MEKTVLLRKYIELLHLLDLKSRIRNFISWYQVDKNHETKLPFLENPISKIEEILIDTGYEKFVSPWFNKENNKSNNGDKSAFSGRNSIPTQLHDYIENCFVHINSIPSNIEKAEAYCLALFYTDPTPLLISHHWEKMQNNCTKAELNGYVEKALLSQFESDYYLKQLQQVRMLSRINHLHKLDDFNYHKNEIRRSFEELSDKLTKTDPNTGFLPNNITFYIYIWLCSREPKIRPEIFGIGIKVTKSLIKWLNHDGSFRFLWSVHKKNSLDGTKASLLLTAITLNLIAIFADSVEFETQISKSISWILKLQTAEGYWSTTESEYDFDLLTTLAVIDALKRFAPEDADDAIRRATIYVLSAQTKFGGWESRNFNIDFLLVNAIEILNSEHIQLKELNAFLKLSREMIYKSKELLIHGQTSDCQLAIIAAHLACEMFLYGYFSTSSQQINFIKPNKDTVGLNEALLLLENRLKSDGSLSQEKGLKFRSDISLLNTIRDQITHKGITITKGEASLKIDAAWKFISHYSEMLLGFPLV